MNNEMISNSFDRLQPKTLKTYINQYEKGPRKMKYEKKACLIGVLVWLVILLPLFQANAAQSENPSENPWEKFGVNLGVFVSALDTTFRIGSGVGLDIDVEEALDLDTSDTVFRTEASWRFT